MFENREAHVAGAEPVRSEVAGLVWGQACKSLVKSLVLTPDEMKTLGGVLKDPPAVGW